MKIIYSVLFGLGCLLVVSCKGGNDGVDLTNVFRYNQPANITSLDPAFAKSQNNMWAVHHLYNTLIKLDDSLRLQPGIAKSWQVSDDGLTYTFVLRDDVFFHRNVCFASTDSIKKLTAVDVAYSLRRLVDSTLSSPGSWLFSDKIDSYDAFKAVDDTTFTITIYKPFVPLLQLLTMQYCSIVPKEAVDYYGGDFRTHPVGTGPYSFKRWVDNQALFLVKNDDYFESNFFAEGTPEYIKTTFIPDKQIASLELLNGNIDLISGIESSFINEFLDKQGQLKANKKDKVRYVRSPYLNTEYIGINQVLAKDHPGLKHKYFRQALNFAIDRQLLLNSLRNGVGLPANSAFTPMGLPSFDAGKVPGYTYDVEKAKELIRKCGITDVNALPPIEINTNAEYIDLATFVAKQWEAIGVKTKIELLDTGILRDGMRNNRLQLFRGSWIADYPDAESYLCVFYSKNPAPPNYTRYANPEFDRLYEKAVSTVDESARYELYQAMERLVVEDAPLIFLFYDQSSIFTGANIKGYTNNGLNLLNVNKIIKS